MSINSNNKIETLVGFLIVLVAVAFMVFTYKVADVKKFTETYKLRASFAQVAGVIVGSDVMLSGIKIGSVSDLKLDPNTYRAIMIISIKKDIHIPDDSSISVLSNGLLGDKYVSINVGSSDNMFTDGDEFKFTTPPISVEALIGKLFFSGDNSDKSQKNISK
jgi:phospholipid/cholesterol/gamma-HCH transport system substrate-binding protein